MFFAFRALHDRIVSELDIKQNFSYEWGGA